VKLRIYRNLYRLWQLCHDTGINLFQAGVEKTLSSLPGWAALGLSGYTTETPITLLDALRAIELRDKEGSPAPSLVVTLPTVARGSTSTREAARELLLSAKKELLVIGFNITDETFIQDVIQCGVRGVQVTIVTERTSGDARYIRREWPALAKPLLLLESVEPNLGQSSIMHGKVIVSDRHDALIGSANFTSGGFKNNIEFGLRVTGEIAGRVCEIIEQLHRGKWLVETV
jgi:phosphatidylserine/phosphatidylglycerophosphate/cardiolipin synthase-like enzyme